MREDYIRTAYATGRAGARCYLAPRLKNAILPVVTVIGIEFAFLIGGLVVTRPFSNCQGWRASSCMPS